MEFKTAEAQRDELLQRARRKGLPIRTGQRRVKAEPAWLHDADLAAQKHEEAVADAVEKCADDTKGHRCCAKRCPWHDVPLERVIKPRSR